MIPAPFDYEVAESVDHAIALLGARDDAKLLAGGHSLLPLLRLRLARPSLLVDVGRLDELSYVRDAGDVDRDRRADAPSRRRDGAAPAGAQPARRRTRPGLIGDPQVRHRGTIGGSLAHGDPASDLPAVAARARRRDRHRGPGRRAHRRGARLLPRRLRDRGRAARARDRGPRAEAHGRPRLELPQVPPAGAGLGDGRRRGGRAALERRRREPAIALVNMGATPLRARAAEAAWAAGADPGAVADEGTDPPSDTNGSAEYRRHLVQGARAPGGGGGERALARP